MYSNSNVYGLHFKVADRCLKIINKSDHRGPTPLSHPHTKPRYKTWSNMIRMMKAGSEIWIMTYMLKQLAHVNVLIKPWSNYKRKHSQQTLWFIS